MRIKTTTAFHSHYHVEENEDDMIANLAACRNSKTSGARAPGRKSQTLEPKWLRLNLHDASDSISPPLPR